MASLGDFQPERLDIGRLHEDALRRQQDAEAAALENLPDEASRVRPWNSSHCQKFSL